MWMIVCLACLLGSDEPEILRREILLEWDSRFLPAFPLEQMVRSASHHLDNPTDTLFGGKPGTDYTNETQLCRADALWMLGRYDESRADVDAVLRALPDDVDLQWRLSRDLARRGDWKQARQIAEAGAKQDPKHAGLACVLALCDEADGADGTQRLDEVIGRTVYWPEALKLRAFLHLRRGGEQGAFRDSTAAIKETAGRYPGDHYAFFVRGVALTDMGREREGLYSLLAARERDPAWEANSVALYWCYQRCEKPFSAAYVAEELFQRTPDRNDYALLAAGGYDAIGMMEQAKQAAGQAGDSADAEIARAWVAVRGGETKAGLEAFEGLTKKYPEDPEVLGRYAYCLAVAEPEQAQPDRARALSQDCLRHVDERWRGHALWIDAVVHAAGGDFAAAAGRLDEALFSTSAYEARFKQSCERLKERFAAGEKFVPPTAPQRYDGGRGEFDFSWPLRNITQPLPTLEEMISGQTHR